MNKNDSTVKQIIKVIYLRSKATMPLFPTHLDLGAGGVSELHPSYLHVALEIFQLLPFLRGTVNRRVLKMVSSWSC